MIGAAVVATSELGPHHDQLAAVESRLLRRRELRAIRRAVRADDQVGARLEDTAQLPSIVLQRFDQVVKTEKAQMRSKDCAR
jgi:hypothetical protein